MDTINPPCRVVKKKNCESYDRIARANYFPFLISHGEARRLYGDAIATFQELGDKSGIASTLGQMGKLAQQQGELKDALGYFLGALVRFLELQSPYRNLALRLIRDVRAQARQEQFMVWLEEFISDEASRRALMEMLDEGQQENG